MEVKQASTTLFSRLSWASQRHFLIGRVGRQQKDLILPALSTPPRALAFKSLVFGVQSVAGSATVWVRCLIGGKMAHAPAIGRLEPSTVPKTWVSSPSSALEHGPPAPMPARGLFGGSPANSVRGIRATVGVPRQPFQVAQLARRCRSPFE